MITKQLGELVELALRCSPAETLREQVSRHFAFFNRKKSPATGDPRAVCIIAENTAWGGTERHTDELIKSLLAKGYHVRMICGNRTPPGPELEAMASEAFEVILVPLSIHDANSKRAWTRMLRSVKSYVVVLPCPQMSAGSFGFLRAVRRSFSSVTFIAHCTPEPWPKGMSRPSLGDLMRVAGRAYWIEQLRRRYRMRCADCIITVSENARQRLISDWSARPNQVTTIHNGVDRTWSETTSGLSEQAVAEGQTSRNTLVFGMVTRLSQEKGVDIALQAFASFCKARPKADVKLLIAGAGPEEGKLGKGAEQLGIEDRVDWLGFESDPRTVYQRIDAVLLPSREEAMPLALLEAMAAGVIPIAFGVGGIPEVIRDASLGWLVEPGDVEGFAGALGSVFDLSEEARADFGVRLASHIQSHFDADQQLAKLQKAAGLDNDSNFRKRFLMSKARDMGQAWLDYFRLWLYAHRRPEAAQPRPTADHLSAHTSAKPSVCVLEESHGWGGAENHTYQLIEHLHARGFPLEYVCGLESLTTPPCGLYIQRAPISIFDDGMETESQWLEHFASLKSRVLVLPALDVNFGRSLGFMKAIRKTFDRIIYIEHTLPPAMPTRTSKRYLGGLIPGYSLWWHKERLRRKLRMRCPSKIVAVSDSVRDHFIKIWDCPAQKIVTIRNGVNCERFAVTPEQRENAKHDQGIPRGTRVFGMMARLSEEKGVDLALRAFAQYRAMEPTRPSVFVVAGTGPEEQPLRDLADELGVSEQVRWLGFRRDTPAVFAMMDVVLASSRFEGLPLALLEGMAGGVVPIVFRVGGMPEVVDDPSLGWVVEPGDITGFAQAMDAFSQLSDEQIESYRQRVTQCVREKFNLENANGRIAALIEQEAATVPKVRATQTLHAWEAPCPQP